MVNRRSGLGYENGESSNPNPDLTQVMQALVAALNSNRQNHDNGPMNRTRAMNEFCKRRPPTFHGDTNPIVAETWLKEVKVILDTLKITRDGDRVALAAYQLKGEARYWWDLMEATHDIAAMTFAQFETLFLDKYFPTPIRLAKEQEFMTLKQGTMIVTQYAAKFEELSRYASDAVTTEDKKPRRFEWGLTTARRTVVAQTFATYTDVVKCALRLESEEADFKTRWRKATSSTGGPIRTQTSNNNHGPYPIKPPNPLRSNQSWETATPGHGEPHRGGQEITTVRCYNCQAMGHIRRNCPQPQKRRDGNFGQAGFVKQNIGGPSQQQIGHNQGKQPIGYQPSTGGRIFALQTKEQEQDPSVIQGTLLLYSTCVQAMLDSRASHSFVSITCVTTLALETEPLSASTKVSSPMGKE
jgi:hypothetical protein